MPISEFLNNSGGINLTDSPLTMKDNQATGQSYNYDYAKTGAISKVLGHARISATPDTQLKTLGLGVYSSVSANTKTVIRAAGTKVQTFDIDSGATVDLSEDTAVANSTFLTSGSTQPVVFSQYNTPSLGTQLWMAGGGMSAIYGYAGTRLTKNGADPATGSALSLSQAGGSGTFSATGVYFYAVVLRKRDTQAVSNAALDNSITLAATVNQVTITLPTVDTTKYDKFLIYRSAVSGVTAFTSGSLVATVNSTEVSYVDTGSSEASAQVVPRSGNTTDNSVLPTGTYKYLTLYKRRLVTCLNSKVYISDLNKPESWSTTITVPTGGPITGIAKVGYNSPYSNTPDELLVIFKENECWVITGSTSDDFELKFLDEVGCIEQTYIIPFNGYLAWADYRGIYIWDGHGKPVYCSRSIEAVFSSDGDLDKTKLSYGWGKYVQKENQLVWRVSDRVKGEQKLSIKMDTRLTLPSTSNSVDQRILDGVFILDTDDTPMYAGLSYKMSNYSEVFIAGDDAGYVLKLNSSTSNPGSTGIDFTYETKPWDMGKPTHNKSFQRVLVLVERLTNNDLTMNYWVDYRQRPDEASEVTVNLAPIKAATAALWDIAFWDQAFWDDYTPDLSFAEFHIHSNENNAVGSTLKLKFEQTESSAPVRIHGIFVDWEDLGPISIATPQAV